jgi:hypothetical protein
MEQTIVVCDSADRSSDGRKSQLAEKQQIAVVRPLLYVALSLCMLLWIALYNGYPTVFSDTGGYLFTGKFLIAVPPFRSPGYSIFIRLTSMGVSAWFTIAAQAIVIVYLLYKTCEHLIGGGSKFRDNCVLAIICVLAALTSLPWEVSLLMPDVFAGMMFLSAFLLAFNDQLRLAERIGLAAILMVSVSAHMSLLPIAALFAAALAVPRFAYGSLRRASPAASMFAWLLVPIIAAAFWTATLNRRTGLGFRLSSSGNTFLLARLFQDGLAADFLRENCPGRPFVACRYVGNLPRTQEEFLFQHPMLHDIAGPGNEIAEIVRGTLAAYPLRFIMSSIKETFRQLAAIRTGDEIRSSNASYWNAAVMRQVFPRDFQAFRNARQSRGRLVWLADTAATIDTTMYWLSLVSCLALVWAGRARKVSQFLYSAISFLAINAAICATFAGVYDRYQSRIAWIVPLCFTTCVCCLVGERKRRVSPEFRIQTLAINNFRDASFGSQGQVDLAGTTES